MEDKVAELAGLAQELEESANEVMERARRVRTVDDRQSDDSDECDESDDDDQGEMEHKLLLKLNHIRDTLKESIRRGKDERAIKLARLYERRFELEQLNAAVAAEDIDVTPPPPAKSSWLLHLLGAVFFGLTLAVTLWTLVEYASVYQERELALHYLHPT